MNPAHEILVRVLAKTDALYAPDRGGLPDRHSHLAANLAQHRRRYVARGVPWASEAAGDVHRKESQRTLDDLVLQNALVADRQAGRTIGVRLTDQADAYTRSLVALPTLAEAWPTLLLLRELTRTMRRAPETDGSTPEFRSRLICETLLLVDRDGNRKKFDYDLERYDETKGCILGVEWNMLPLFCRGWVTSAATTEHHVFYIITPAGHVAAQQAPPKLVEDDLPDASEPECNLYDNEFARCRQYWSTAQPPDGNEIVFHLPAGVDYGCPHGRKNNARRKRNRAPA